MAGGLSASLATRPLSLAPVDLLLDEFEQDIPPELFHSCPVDLHSSEQRSHALGGAVDLACLIADRVIRQLPLQQITRVKKPALPGISSHLR